MTEKSSRRTAPQIKSHGKIFDMVPPDQAMPSSNARPVLVTHRAMVRDPMVAEPKDNTPTKAPTSTSAESEQPTKDEAAQTEADDRSTVELVAKEAAEPPQSESVDSEQITETPSKEQPLADDIPEDTLEAEANESDAAGIDKTSAAAKKSNGDEQTKRIAEAEALITSKKYFVPINAVRRRRSRQLLVVLLLLALVGGGAAYYYMMYMVK